MPIRVLYYGMPRRASKQAADLNQIAKSIVDKATSEDEPKAVEDESPEKPKRNPAAVALGKLGAKKGGFARAKKLSKKRRSEIATKAARARWRHRN